MKTVQISLIILLLAFLGACSDADSIATGPEDMGSGDVSLDAGSTDVVSDVPVDTGPDIDPNAVFCHKHDECKSKAKPCQSYYCDSPDEQLLGQCVFTFVDVLTPCDDGNVCTQVDKCNNGHVCQGGGALDCTDGSQCTQDSCDPISGCLHVKIDIPCDDGSACTTAEKCANGLCLGKAVLCDDGDQCTFDKCVEDKGCVYEKQTNALCDDGDVCTNNDMCQKGVCMGDFAQCDDGNPCTYNKCDKVTGCSYQPVNDGNACDDGDKCTLNDLCQSSVCQPGTKKNCNDNNVCTDDSCEVATGICLHPSKTNATYCDDNSKCTQNDHCEVTDGKCVGTKIQCVDGVDCTVDSCDPNSGCIFNVQDNLPCNDGNACTQGDICTSAVCQGYAMTCDDLNPCTNDYCDPAVGACVHTSNDGYYCTDNNVCSTDDKCVGTQCVGNVISCNDSNPCTDDNCNAKIGCISKPTNNAPCDDGNACSTGDKCDSFGTCIAMPKNCDDNNKCTTDACDTKTGACTNTTILGCIP